MFITRYMTITNINLKEKKIKSKGLVKMPAF